MERWFALITQRVIRRSPTKIFVSTAGRVSGTVKTASGGVIANAVVTFTGGSLRLSSTVTTNSGGSYLSNWISVGTYQVTVSAMGHTPAQAPVSVNTGLTTTLNITLQ